MLSPLRIAMDTSKTLKDKVGKEVRLTYQSLILVEDLKENKYYYLIKESPRENRNVIPVIYFINRERVFFVSEKDKDENLITRVDYDQRDCAKVLESSSYPKWLYVTDRGDFISKTLFVILPQYMDAKKRLYIEMSFDSEDESKSLNKKVLVKKEIVKTFHLNPDNKEFILNKNGDIFDNSVSNLIACTNSEKGLLAKTHGQTPNPKYGIENGSSVLSEEKIARIWYDKFAKGPSNSALAKDFGVSKSTISSLVNGETYVEEQKRLGTYKISTFLKRYGKRFSIDDLKKDRA